MSPYKEMIMDSQSIDFHGTLIALSSALDLVGVDEVRHGNRVTLELSVSKEDMGRVIGRSGRVANAIRTLLRVAAERDGCQATLDVVEP